ncbi:MAG: hypothetical protein ACK4GD_06080 [Sphingomonadaceae bacterium]
MNHLILAIGFSGLALLAAPLAAQESLRDDVRMSIVYGEDAAPECPRGEICVVARLPEDERFRIPPNLRFSEDPGNTAWTRRVESLEMIGDFGTMSCSTAGAGGFTGCTQQMIRAAYGDRAAGADVRFSELIASARADRLSQIDATAAEQQERVEQIEREYMERLERERAAELPGERPIAEETGDSSAASPEAG